MLHYISIMCDYMTLFEKTRLKSDISLLYFTNTYRERERNRILSTFHASKYLRYDQRCI